MGCAADAGFEPRKTEFPPDARSKPGIGRWQAGPCTLVEAAENHEVGLNQLGLDQTQYRDARMAALNRAHRNAAQHIVEQRREGADVRLLRAFRGRLFQLREQIGGGVALHTGPYGIAGQCSGLFAEGRQLRGKGRGGCAGLLQRFEQRARLGPPLPCLGSQRLLAILSFAFVQEQIDPLKARRRTRAA